MRRSSFRRLAVSHLDLLYGAALRAARSRDRAEDLVQETYRIAFDRWTTLRDPAACRAWLLRILHSVHIDEIRRTRRLVALEGDALQVPDPRTLGDPFAAASKAEIVERLGGLLDEMPDDARWLFGLREVEGLSYAELSEVFEVPVGTIRSRLARLRGRLVADLSARGVRRSKPAREEGDV